MIEVENLTKLYGESLAVRDVSFYVDKGEILGFLGPNGAGKTTTMRILSCFMAPTGGTARIAGFDILQNSLEVRRNIGYLPENVPLYLDMSVRDYLMHVAALRGVPKAQRAERLEAALDAGKLEDRVDTIIGKLSKGYRQRVGLAQAVIHDPPVLILDEPSAGLDPRQRVETRRFIKSLAKDHTIILSTHILPDVQDICSRVVIIDKGRLVAQDTTRHLEDSTVAPVRLVLTRPTATVGPELRSIAGVQEVIEVQENRQSNEETDEDNAHTFLIEAVTDIREAIARRAVENDWGLVELRQAHRSLEEIFIELTAQDHAG